MAGAAGIEPANLRLTAGYIPSLSHANNEMVEAGSTGTRTPISGLQDRRSPVELCSRGKGRICTSDAGLFRPALYP